MPQVRFDLVVKALLLLALGVWMIPVVYMVSVALRPPAHAFDPQLFTLPLTLDNFSQVIKDNPLPAVFLNSLIVTLGTVCAVLAAGSLFAYACSILKLWGTITLYTILLTTLMIPIASLVLPLAVMLKQFGLINHYLGLIAPYSALGIPFAIVILKALLEDSPMEIYESAIVDGCTPWQMYYHVALPLIRPAMAFVGIWQFITTWNEFFLALIVMTDASYKTLTIVPMQYSGLYMANPGALFAVLVLIALPLILLYIVVQRHFVAGLIAGAVKG
jgi:raffinose/stachyose/melibiose transport system permease protein